MVSLPSERFTRFGNPAWPGGRTANFAAFGAWPWVLPKNAESLRDSDALMRVAVPRRRGPAGLRSLFSHLQKLQFSCPTHEVFCTCMVCLPMMISILPITCSSSNLRTAHFASAFLFLQYLLLAVLLRLPAALTIHFACD